jgi:3-oxo-5alpha-steroid 4-dehydrogenase
VGINGRRIGNEDLYGATHSEALVRKFGGTGFLIVDAKIWKRSRSQIIEQTMIFQRMQLAWVFSVGRRKAPTLSGLAQKLGISQTGLVGTVNEYNEAIAAGIDDPEHKATSIRAPITEGPFYGVDISVRPSLAYPALGLTLGGLRVDERTGLVLRADETTVPGLYAAGRTAVGLCSNSYVSGLALADCVFSGRRAGNHAASTLARAARPTVERQNLSRSVAD